jgi:peptide/nickel transport system substrate-binding protein
MQRARNLLVLVVLSAMLILLQQTAQAQRSDSVVRIPLLNPISVLDYYHDGSRETIFESQAIYDKLIQYNEPTKKYEPLLAKSWTRIDDQTLEFELRDDVQWHDGQSFSADDIIYTLKWLTDAETKIRFKRNFEHIASIEKLGQNKIRIKNVAPTPSDLAGLAVETWMFPAHIHGKLSDKSSFGKKPVGTGPFRATQVDTNRGVILEAVKSYNHGGPDRSAHIAKYVLRPIPDPGTQIAELLAGNLDAIVPVEIDQAKQLTADKRFAMTMNQSIFYNYLNFDATGRSDSKPLTDVRVRRALMMTIDPKAMAEAATGNRDFQPLPTSMCWAAQEGCGVQLANPPYDPAGAKKLLEAAGYPNGFDIVITTRPGGQYSFGAQMISGFFSKVGVRASINVVTNVGYRSLQRENKVQIYYGPWTAGGMPDVSSTLNFLGAESASIQEDATFAKLAAETMRTMDVNARRVAGGKTFDYVTEQGYLHAITPYPMIIVHNRDLDIQSLGRYNAFGFEPGDVKWK